MTRTRTFLGMTLAVLVAAGVLGCMKRKETLTIARDGGVRMLVEFEADSRDELFGGDVTPSEESGWKTETAVETDKDGKETHKLTAEASFAPRAALPGSFAAASDPCAEQYLRFPTTVTLEERADGTYYHFHRVYPRRDWAQVETVRKMLLDDKVKEVSEKDAADVTHEERVELVKALAQAAMFNMLTFARAAYLDVTPTAAQDGWLRVETGLRQLHDGLDFERLAAIMENPDKEAADRTLAAEAAALESTALDGLVAGLRESGYTERQTAAFLDRYAWHKRTHDITADLGDDDFEIVVEMPGEFVDADIFGSHNGNEVRWSFTGEMFRDRDLELMATFRVAKE